MGFCLMLQVYGSPDIRYVACVGVNEPASVDVGQQADAGSARELVRAVIMLPSIRRMCDDRDTETAG